LADAANFGSWIANAETLADLAGGQSFACLQSGQQFVGFGFS
jgi:hypothetical protein